MLQSLATFMESAAAVRIITPPLLELSATMAVRAAVDRAALWVVREHLVKEIRAELLEERTPAVAAEALVRSDQMVPV
jgi:hypothetical protein